MIAKYYRPDFVKNPKRRRTPHSKKEKSKAATHAAHQKGKIQSGDEHRTPKRKNPKRRRTPHSKKEKSKAATNTALQKGKIQSGDERRTPKRKNPKRRRTPHSKIGHGLIDNMANLANLIDRLRGILGEGAVLASPSDLVV